MLINDIVSTVTDVDPEEDRVHNGVIHLLFFLCTRDVNVMKAVWLYRQKRQNHRAVRSWWRYVLTQSSVFTSKWSNVNAQRNHT